MEESLLDSKLAPSTWKNPSETAQLFRVSIRTIHRWRKHKLLPAAQLGGTYYFPIPVIEQMMRQRAKNSLIKELDK